MVPGFDSRHSEWTPGLNGKHALGSKSVRTIHKPNKKGAHTVTSPLRQVPFMYLERQPDKLFCETCHAHNKPHARTSDEDSGAP